MIHTQENYRTETRKNMRDGSGDVLITHLWDAEKDLKAPNRMVARITLNEGCSIGFHRHENEEEIFYILSGCAEAEDDGKKVFLNAGDTILTGNGAGHAIANAGTKPLEILAVITKYTL